jgi:transposase InsO family protein
MIEFDTLIIPRACHVFRFPKTCSAFKVRKKFYVTSLVDPANGAVGVSRQLELPRFPNQVRGADIAYVAVGRAHMYLTCAIDRYSRCIVGWRLAADMGAAPAELRREIADYVEQRNGVRPHQSLGNDRPSEWYHSGLMAA